MADGVDPAAAELSRRLLRAVYQATFFIRFAFGLTLSVFAAYLTGHFSGLNLGEVGVVGIVAAAAPLGEFSTVLLSGIQADHYGRFPILLSGMLGAAGLFVLASLTRSAAALGVINLLFGVSSGAILAASLALVGDHADPRVRGHAMGRFDATNLMGWILGFAVGFGLLAALPNGELPWLFRGGAAALVAGAIFALAMTQGYTEPKGLPGVDLGHVKDAIVRRDVLLVALPWLVIYMFIGAALAFLGSAGSGVGVPPSELALAIGGAGFLLLLTQPAFGSFADRFGRFRLMAVGTAGFLGVMGSLAGIIAWGTRPELLAALGVSALAALGYGPAALAALADLSRALTRGTTMAVYSLVISVGMIAGLLASTTLYSHLGNGGVDAFFGLVGAGLLVLTLMRGLDLRSGRANVEPPQPPTTAGGGDSVTIPVR
ncbi:MAG TPA: MFS transporter [Thermoplasmata archaeon]|nr:MFS transporter [Thermoplasmata archaeon]